jgi:GNAT superfamily N-acetyltransferase
VTRPVSGSDSPVVREIGPGETGLAHAAMRELRPAFGEDRAGFVRRIDEAQRPQGYRLFGAFDLGDDQAPAAAVAGFRRITNLAWGDVLYLDDLSTREAFRGRGLGTALLDAVHAEARELGCDAVHLDSGHHRYGAHRLYLGAGYEIRSHHFVRPVD